MLMLMAYGPNNVAIPCRFFENAEQAKAFTDQWMIPQYVQVLEHEGRSFWRIHAGPRGGGELDPALAAALFTTYYGGCGEASRFDLVPLHINQPFLKWDLD